MSVAIFKISDDEVEDVRVIMYNIRLKDSSFGYSVVKARDGNGYLLLVYGENKDDAHRRAAWIWDKVFGKDRAYWVK